MTESLGRYYAPSSSVFLSGVRKVLTQVVRVDLHRNPVGHVYGLHLLPRPLISSLESLVESTPRSVTL